MSNSTYRLALTQPIELFFTLAQTVTESPASTLDGDAEQFVTSALLELCACTSDVSATNHSATIPTAKIATLPNIPISTLLYFLASAPSWLGSVRAHRHHHLRVGLQPHRRTRYMCTIAWPKSLRQACHTLASNCEIEGRIWRIPREMAARLS